MNLIRRMITRYKARKEYEAKQAEFDARIEAARRKHAKVKPVMEERRKFVLEAVSNKRVREILGAER